jgi:hypothetical protein
MCLCSFGQPSNTESDRVLSENSAATNPTGAQCAPVGARTRTLEENALA